MLVLDGCSESDEPPAFEGMSELALVAPDSTLVADLSRPRKVTIEGTNRATAGHRYGSDATADDVVGFFERELSSRGWVPSQDVSRIRGTNESLVHVWQKGEVVYRLSVLRKDDPRLMPDLSLRFKTIYDAVLIDATDPPMPDASS
jgi:hypothetical protein